MAFPANTVVVSKVKGGQLTFTASTGASAGTASDYSCQFTSVAITPADTDTTSSSDTNYVLCGLPIPADATSGGSTDIGTLDFTVISDHNTVDGLIAFSWLHRGEVVAFSFTPDKTPAGSGEAAANATAQTWAGTVLMKPLVVGGEVQGDLRITGSLKIQSLTPPTGFGAPFAPSKSFAAPGTVYPAEGSLGQTANATEAAKLGDGTGNTGLKYIPVPKTAWLTGQAITIGNLKFHWSGTAWAAGPAT